MVTTGLNFIYGCLQLHGQICKDFLLRSANNLNIRKLENVTFPSILDESEHSGEFDFACQDDKSSRFQFSAVPAL